LKFQKMESANRLSKFSKPAEAVHHYHVTNLKNSWPKGSVISAGTNPNPNPNPNPDLQLVSRFVLTTTFMVRSFLPRFPLLRALAPRVSSPLLPTTRGRPLPPKLISTPRQTNSRLFHHFPARLTNSPIYPRSPSPDPRSTLPSNASLSQKLKHLIKSYGWYALGVYLVLSALDFGVAFAGVNLLGAEYVSQVATSMKETITNVLHSHPPEPGMDEIESASARPGQSGQEGLYAMLVLAYTIHKTLFLPVRVGLTAAFTPKLVGWLSQRGWAGGAGTKRAATEMRERLRDRRNRDN
jgi:hypothetical protein